LAFFLFGKGGPTGLLKGLSWKLVWELIWFPSFQLLPSKIPGLLDPN